MKQLNDNELMNITGGAGITATMLNAASRAISTLLDLGRSFGTAIRRAIDGSVCPL